MLRINLGGQALPPHQNSRNPLAFANCSAESPASTLVRLFRSDALRRVEYSLGATPNACGTMVASQGGDFAKRVRQFAERLEFARPWGAPAERFCRLCGADLFYFKIDQENRFFSKLTIYGRYFKPIGNEAMQNLETTIIPILWRGPSPILLATLFHTKGPQGVGFEVDRDGFQNLSYYFEIESELATFTQGTLPIAFTSWGWPEQVLAQVTLDVENLFPSHFTGWIALDVDEKKSITMKLDLFRVPVRKAIAFLQTKGLVAAGEERLLHFCEMFRCNTFNTLALPMMIPVSRVGRSTSQSIPPSISTRSGGSREGKMSSFWRAPIFPACVLACHSLVPRQVVWSNC